MVTTVNFNQIIDIGDPVSQAKIYQAQAADELVILNIRPQTEDQDAIKSILKRMSEEVFMPLTIGGGIRSISDIQSYLAVGADKVSINTTAVENSDFISEAANYFGVQCIVVSIDYRWVNGKPLVVTQSGSHQTDLTVQEWAKECEKKGAGEILLTAIDRDGSSEGLDIQELADVAQDIDIPVIASGGCGLTQHFIDGFHKGHADAVAAGTYFCFKDENPMQTRSQIRNSGTPIRILT